MYRLRLIIIGILFHVTHNCCSQNISGIINSYASVSNISGSNLIVNSSTGFGAGDRLLLIQMKGASVTSVNTSFFGDITSMGGAGTYEFLDIAYATGTLIALVSAPVHTYNTTSGFVQAVAVPKYCMPTVTNTLICPIWSPTAGTGGVIALEAGTLTLNSDIDASGAGFNGGNYATSYFACSNGGFAAAWGVSGGQKGESISAYMTNLDGLKGKQANGGGASNSGNSGGGGGGNGGPGGVGGNEYSGCGTSFNEKGIGGLGLTSSFSTLFMGGGGGGGFRDNGQTCTAGANGGGIIYIHANMIICNSRTITAAGGSVTIVANDEGAGGGGAGGSIFLECNNFTGNLTVKTDGGSGGTTYNTLFIGDCHGPGGGGGGGTFAIGTAAIPGGLMYSSVGGTAGLVTNPLSSCYNTTFGAAAGSTGLSLTSLPFAPLAFNIPTVTISQSNTICAGQSTTLTATGATSYSWNTGANTPVITVAPVAGTQYTVTGYNGSCSSSATKSVAIIPLPPVSIFGDSIICTGHSAVITASGAASYSWNTGASTNSITVSPGSTTSYTVTGSSGGCSATASHTLLVTVMPTVVITGPTSICNGQTVTLNVSTANNYSWNTGAVTSTLAASPSVTTTYYVVGANGSCSVSTSHFINVIPVPTLNVAGASTICAGTSATISASGASSYSWSTGSTSHSIVAAPATPGITFYNVIGTANSCSTSVTHTLSVIAMPTVNILGNAQLCSGQSLTLSAFYANTITWNTGATSSLIVVSPSVSTTYSVIGANGACTVSAVKAISVTPSPVVAASVSSPSICSGSTVQLSASGALSYLWSTGATNTLITVTPLATSVYTLYGTSNNCTSLSLVTITVIPTPNLSPGNYSLCIGTTEATLTANGATSYSWSPNYFLSSTTGSVVIANPLNTTTYVLQGFNSSCSSSVNVVVQTYTTPHVQISSSADFVCKGNSVNLTGTGANSYTWQPATDVNTNTAGSVLVVPLSTSVYTLYGIGENNCQGVAVKTIAVLSTPQTNIGPESYVVCEGSSVELHASGAESYSWSPSAGLSSMSQSNVIAAPPATQVYTVTGYNGVLPDICAFNATLIVNVQSYSILKITAPDSICYGQRVNLLASGAKNYTWSPSSFLSNPFISNPAITPKDAVTYTITGVSSNSCPGTTTLTIFVKPVPFVYAGRDTTLNFDQSAFLKGDGDGLFYTWKGNDLSGLNCINCPETFIHPQNSTCYVLETENSHGCIARDEVCVEVTHDHGIYIPNSFSPNGDGVNDLFTPLGFGVISFELFIYDRWGEKLFEGTGSFINGPLVSWDGNYKGVKCKTDSYVYSFIYTLPGSKKLSRQGEVILLGPKD